MSKSFDDYFDTDRSAKSEAVKGWVYLGVVAAFPLSMLFFF